MAAGAVYALALLYPKSDRTTSLRRPVQLMIVEPPEETEKEPPKPPEPEFRGQIVELAPPEEEEVPLEADYLAAADQRVEEETRTERVTVNPEVLAPQFSEEQRAESEDVVDLNVTKRSTGATVGNRRFDPTVDGSLASMPSPWQRTNRPGPADPIPAAALEARLSGAPQNDKLDEKIGDRVALNARRYPYEAYMRRIRRQVNFWWEQRLNNLPSGLRLSKLTYITGVEVILDDKGNLKSIRVIEESGSMPIDQAVVTAFEQAQPFDNPPSGLIDDEGEVHLPVFRFEPTFGVGEARYEGIDPRAGVQFPGILKSPR
ncbi:MAG: energy transducer TonB [Myxococcota bacterium]